MCIIQLSLCVSASVWIIFTKILQGRYFYYSYFIFFHFILCVGILHACMSVHHMCAVPVEGRRGHRISWNCSYKWLWTAMWELGPLQGQPVLSTSEHRKIKYDSKPIHYSIQLYCYSSVVTVFLKMSLEIFWQPTFLSANKNT